MAGNINVSGTSGNANLSIPIAGSKAKANIYVIANKTEGDWEYAKLDVRVNGAGEHLLRLAR